MSQEIEAGIQELCKRAEAATLAEITRMNDGDEAKALSIHGRITFMVERGSKYARIVKDGPTTHSVYCFVELATGNILKPAGYKAPAKGVRGNVLELDKIKLDPHGSCFYR